MVTSNVTDSLKSILPVPQNLIPVTLKRKMEYSGHYMQEFIDKKKIACYFSWLQSHNHIFKDLKLDLNMIKDFENYTQEVISKADEEKDDQITNHFEMLLGQFVEGEEKEEVEDEEVDENDQDNQQTEMKSRKLQVETVVSSHSSVITDKYMEDIHGNTITNKFW